MLPKTAVFVLLAIWLPGLKCGFENEENDSNAETATTPSSAAFGNWAPKGYGYGYAGHGSHEYSICKHNNDIPCIREHFATHSSCHPLVFGNMPSSITFQDVRFQVPYFNMSHNDQQLIIKNLDKCIVIKFTRDEKAHKTILVIECKNVIVESPRRLFILRECGEPNEAYIAKVIAKYGVVTLTMNFNGENLDACRETGHACTSLPTLFVQGLDSESVRFVREDPLGIFNKYTDIWIRTIWEARATALLDAYLRNMFCDFNCNYKKYLS